ncbi:MAG: RNA-processing protein [Candidatus Aenigmatarchaeota archaeon]
MFDYIKIQDKMKKVLIKDKEGWKNLEKITNTKITIEEDVKIEGEGFNVYQTKQVLQAFNRGFPLKDALNLLDDEYGLEIIDLSEVTHSRNRMIVIKGRVIGTKGKTKKMIEEYTETKISVQGKTISILGRWDKINVSKEAVEMIINGCNHSTLYKWLYRNGVKDGK